MTSSDHRTKFKEILAKLLEKAKQNHVNWQAVDASEEVRAGAGRQFRVEGEGLGFKVGFTGAAEIIVRRESSSAAPDRVIAVLRVDGLTVVVITTEEGESDYSLLHSLYREAHRFCVGWNSVLSEIERQLSEAGRVGVEGKDASQ